MKTKLKTDRTYKFIEHKNKVVIHGRINLLSDTAAEDFYEIDLTQCYNEFCMFDYNITHSIYIEPNGCKTYANDIRKKVKIVSNHLNKKYIGNKFNKFKNKRDRFLFFFREETQKTTEHYNILVHTPDNKNKSPAEEQVEFRNEYNMHRLLSDFTSTYYKRFGNRVKIFVDYKRLGVIQDLKKCVSYNHKKLNMSLTENDMTYDII